MLSNPPTYLFVHRKLPSKSDAVKGKKIPLTDAYLGTQKQSFNPANSLEFKRSFFISCCGDQTRLGSNGQDLLKGNTNF